MKEVKAEESKARSGKKKPEESRQTNSHSTGKTLDSARKGTYVTISALPAGLLKVQLIRLGITEGAKVYCLERLPGGTIVLQRNRQEIAIGFDLARKIEILTNA